MDFLRSVRAPGRLAGGPRLYFCQPLLNLTEPGTHPAAAQCSGPEELNPLGWSHRWLSRSPAPIRAMRCCTAAATFAGTSTEAEGVAEIELCATAEQAAEALQRVVSAGMRPTIRSGGHCYEDFRGQQSGWCDPGSEPAEYGWHARRRNTLPHQPRAATGRSVLSTCTSGMGDHSRRQLLQRWGRRPHQRGRLRCALAAARPDHRLACRQSKSSRSTAKGMS
jgi:hypothetical protein